MAVCMQRNHATVKMDLSTLTIRDHASPVVTVTDQSDTSSPSSSGSDKDRGQDGVNSVTKPQVTLRILRRGPDYFRNRVLNRRSSAEIAERRKSAVELLQETKSQFYGQSIDSSEQTPHKNQSNCRTQQFLAELSSRRSDEIGDLQVSEKRQSCSYQNSSIQERSRRYSRESIKTQNGRRVSTTTKSVVPGDLSHQSTGMNSAEISQASTMDSRPIQNTSHVATCMASLSVNQSDSHHSSSKSGGNDGGSSSSCVRNNLDVMSVHAADLNWDLDRRSDSALGTDMTIGTAESSVVLRKRSKRSSVHRSRSDLSHRFSNSSDLSELSAHLSRHSQDFDRVCSRNSHDLERFFNEMGLEKGVLDPINVTHLQSLGVFDSVSSLDTADNISIYGRRSDCAAKTDESDPKSSQTSIVERNARIIKWLCSVKRAKSADQ